VDGIGVNALAKVWDRRSKGGVDEEFAERARAQVNSPCGEKHGLATVYSLQAM
jgi:hypothetical protein